MNLRRTSEKLLESLFARINYERQSKLGPHEFKLANMTRFLDRLGNPHLDFPVVHVAGTKGKGSVSAIVGAILKSSGLKIGVYSSPHLERVNQRIRIDGVEVSDIGLHQALAKLAPAIDEFDTFADQTESKKLTFFEVITAAACQVFTDENVDAVVLEVGMGGRLDSTNVCQPIVSVITNISLDHTRQLGSTVDKIALEKAGIIKPGIPVVSGVTNPDAAEVIRNVAKENGSELFERETDFRCLPSAKPDCFDYESDTLKLSDLQLAMFGKHQQINASIAIAVVEMLIKQGWEINSKKVRAGLGEATLAGRCELVPGQKLVVLDMAHNEASMQALAKTLEEDVPGFAESKKKTMIVAVSREKDLPAMLKPMIGLFDSFVVTKYVDNPRARGCQEIESCLTQLLEAAGKSAECVTVIEDPATAWQSVEADDDQAICITGSVFLVAELRPLVLNSTISR